LHAGRMLYPFRVQQSCTPYRPLSFPINQSTGYPIHQSTKYT